MKRVVGEIAHRRRGVALRAVTAASSYGCATTSASSRPTLSLAADAKWPLAEASRQHRAQLVRDLDKVRPMRLPLVTDADEVIDDPAVDIVIEVIGGEEPAYGYLREALTANKFVVTANKELLANVGPELFEAAISTGSR